MRAGEVAEYTALRPLNVSLRVVDKTGDADRSDLIELWKLFQ